MWQAVVELHTSDLQEDSDIDEIPEVEAAIDNLFAQVGTEGARAFAASVKYEFSDALWDEIEPLLNTSTGIDSFERGDCEGIDYVRITDPAVLLGSLSSTARVKARMHHSLEAALEQFACDDGGYSRPLSGRRRDRELDAMARRLRGGVCTTRDVALDVRERQLVETIGAMKGNFQWAQFVEEVSRYGDDDSDDDGGYTGIFGTAGSRKGERDEKRRIAYQFATDHLCEALKACRELKQSLAEGSPPDAQQSQPAPSSRTELARICRDAMAEGQHVVVVHNVI